MSILHRFKTFRLHTITEAGGCSCLDPKCRHQGKHPATFNGVKDAALNSEEHFKGFNVGIACGEGFIVIDVDPRNGGEQKLEELESEIGKLPDTWTCHTGGGGTHQYFAITANITTHHLGGVDVQSTGAYVVAPPSRHLSGRDYVWDSELHPEDIPMAPLPDAWSKYLISLQQPKKSAQRLALNVTDDEFKLVMQQMRRIPPDCEYDDWLGVGMALHSTGHSLAFDAWDRWSKHGADKYPGEHELRKKWKTFDQGKGITFESVYRIADKHGIEPKFGKPELPGTPFPGYPAGVVGTLALYYERNSRVPVRDFAMAAALQTIAGVTQGLYELPNGGTTNLYTLICARPGGGKNAYIEWVKNCLRKVNSNLLAGEPGSNRGLRRTLGAHPNRVYIKDELVRELEALAGPRANSTNNQLINDYLTMWGKVQFLPAIVNKKVEDSIPQVDNPTFSIFGTGTISGFRDLLQMKVIKATGLLSRFDIVISSDEPELNYTVSPIVVEEINDYLQIINGSGYKMTFTNSAFERIKEIDREVRRQFASMGATERDDPNSTLSRRSEKIERYAGLVAIGDDSRVVSDEHLDWAVRWVDYIHARMQAEIEVYGAPSEHAIKCSRVVAYLAQSGGIALQRDVCRNAICNIPAYEQKSILESLENEGRIEIYSGRRKNQKNVKLIR